MKHMGHIISGAAEDSTESAASAQALFSTAHFSDTVALGRSGQHRLRYFVDTILLALWAQSWVLFLERDLKVIPAHYHCILKTLHVYVCTLPLHTQDFTCLCLHTTTAYWRLYMSACLCLQPCAHAMTIQRCSLTMYHCISTSSQNTLESHTPQNKDDQWVRTVVKWNKRRKKSSKNVETYVFGIHFLF